MEIQVSLTRIIPNHQPGKLLCLADVTLQWGDLEMEIRSIRVERQGTQATMVRMPVDREGRALLIFPKEISDAIGDVVLAGGIESGIFRERFSSAQSVALEAAAAARL